MKTKRLRCLFLVVVVSMFILCFVNVPDGYSTSCLDFDKISDKVIFEGVSVSDYSNASDVAGELNSVAESEVCLIIQLNNTYDIEHSKIDDDNLSLEEYQTVLKKHREKIKDYYSKQILRL